MNEEIWKYFSLDELKCKCGNCYSTGYEMEPELMKPLIVLRETLCFPFVVTSSFRCPEYNNRISNSGAYGPHTTGKAIDIGIFGEAAFYFLLEASKLDVFAGIGVSQKGPMSSRFIHLDVLSSSRSQERSRPRIWSY